MKNCEAKYKEIFDKGRYSGLLELTDAKITTKDKCSFDVHKVMLARCSEYFRAMFCRLDKGEAEYEISSIDGDCLSQILVFIYTGSIYLNEKNIKDLLPATDNFSLRNLYVKIQSHVKSTLTNANCLKFCLMTYHLSNEEIFRCCLNFIIPRFEEIVSTHKHDFDDFPLDLLKRILSNRNLYIKSESIIWQVIVQWIQTRPAVRLEHVPNLLSTLAIAEVSADLATEIVTHEIVHNNVHMKSLKNTISLIGVDRASDAIADFMKDFNPTNFRIPEKLTLLSQSTRTNLKIFISFDETADLWHKIIEVGGFASKKLVVVKSKIYFIEEDWKKKILIFDLETRKLNLVQNAYLTKIKSVCIVGNTFYTTFLENKTCHIDEYDVEEDYNIRVSSLDDFNFPIISATTIDRNIFIVAGNCRMRTGNIVTRMFNVVTHQWTDLASPTKFHVSFKLVSYHNKIYLLDNGSLNSQPPEIEVFDPAINVWKVLPELHNTYSDADLIVLCDKLIVYDYNNDSMASKAELWNEVDECWKALETTPGKMDYGWYRSYIINDTHLIKILTKRNRNSKVKMEKFRFILSDI